MVEKEMFQSRHDCLKSMRGSGPELARYIGWNVIPHRRDPREYATRCAIIELDIKEGQQLQLPGFEKGEEFEGVEHEVRMSGLADMVMWAHIYLADMFQH
jgi:hypothetical protein